MDPRNANNGSELRLNIDPNAFQLALRNGTLTLVPRITPNPNPPLIQLPIQNAANGNQITAPTSQTTYENALTMHYAGQNTSQSVRALANVTLTRMNNRLKRGAVSIPEA